MPNTPLTKEQGRSIIKLFIAGMLCFLLLVGYIFVNDYQRDVQNVSEKREGCERGKKDRQDNADFQKAHKKYIEKVVLAQSVKQDVKDAANKALETYDRTTPSLLSRTGENLDCTKAFEDAELWPW